MLAKCKYGKNLFLIPSKVELHLNAVNVVNYYAHLTHFLAALIEGWVGVFGGNVKKEVGNYELTIEFLATFAMWHCPAS